MKYLYPVSLLFLILASCGKDERKAIDHDKTDWAYYNLKGDVKSLSEKSFETFDGKSKGLSKHEIMSERDRDLKFNNEGMLVLETAWYKDSIPFEVVRYKGRDFKMSHVQYVNGTPSIKTDYVWDEKGKNNLSVIRRNADNSSFDRIVMKYKNDKLLERITYNQQDNPSNRVVYFYDEKGNLKGESVYSATDIVEYKTEYKFDGEGNKMSEKHYARDGKLEYEIRYTYNNKLLVSTETYNAEGDVVFTDKKDYDNKGNLLTEYSFDKFDGKHMRDVYKYDNDGNRVAWATYEGDNLLSKVAYTFDKHNNITKVLAAKADGSVTESKLYNYEYDQNGNWTKKIVILNDKPFIITERKIEYFQ